LCPQNRLGLGVPGRYWSKGQSFPFRPLSWDHFNKWTVRLEPSKVVASRSKARWNGSISDMPDKRGISNDVRPVKHFLSALLRHCEEWSWLFFVDLCINDHGSLVICRSASVRPKHVFDLCFDHDYLFELPLQGAGCPTKWTVSVGVFQ
jgi:hypothetical protein